MSEEGHHRHDHFPPASDYSMSIPSRVAGFERSIPADISSLHPVLSFECMCDATDYSLIILLSCTVRFKDRAEVGYSFPPSQCPNFDGVRTA